MTVVAKSETHTQTPLVVDMDGALLRTDVLFEAIASGLALIGRETDLDLWTMRSTETSAA